MRLAHILPLLLLLTLLSPRLTRADLDLQACLAQCTAAIEQVSGGSCSDGGGCHQAISCVLATCAAVTSSCVSGCAPASDTDGSLTRYYAIMACASSCESGVTVTAPPPTTTTTTSECHGVCAATLSGQDHVDFMTVIDCIEDQLHSGCLNGEQELCGTDEGSCFDGVDPADLPKLDAYAACLADCVSPADPCTAQQCLPNYLRDCPLSECFAPAQCWATAARPDSCNDTVANCTACSAALAAPQQDAFAAYTGCHEACTAPAATTTQSPSGSTGSGSSGGSSTTVAGAVIGVIAGVLVVVLVIVLLVRRRRQRREEQAPKRNAPSNDTSTTKPSSFNGTAGTTRATIPAITTTAATTAATTPSTTTTPATTTAAPRSTAYVVTASPQKPGSPREAAAQQYEEPGYAIVNREAVADGSNTNADLIVPPVPNPTAPVAPVVAVPAAPVLPITVTVPPPAPVAQAPAPVPAPAAPVAAPQRTLVFTDDDLYSNEVSMV